MPEERFSSKEKYRRWNAYRHIHNIKAPHLKRVIIGGVKHDVKHGKKAKGRKAAARKR